MATESTQVDRAALERDGFLLLRGWLPRATVASLVQVVEDGLATMAVKPHGVRNIASRLPEVRRLADVDAVHSILSSVFGHRGRLVRSILFDKIPGSNWKVAWHQDLTISVAGRKDVPGFGPWSVKNGVVSVQPPATVLEGMLTVRLHLDACGPDNGPLRVVPGTHRRGRLGAEEIDRVVSIGPIVECACEAGDVLLMRPLLLHASSPASSPAHRRVVHLDFASAPLSRDLEWSPTV